METENNALGTEIESNSEQSQPQPGPSMVPFDKTLTEVVKNLPPLLRFALGAAIVLVGAGVWGLESLRVLTVPLLILLIVGPMAWVLLEARKQAILQETQKQADPAGPKVVTREIDIAETAKLKEVKAKVGDIELSEMPEASQFETGPITIKGKVEKSQLKGGNIKIGGTDTTDESG